MQLSPSHDLPEGQVHLSTWKDLEHAWKWAHISDFQFVSSAEVLGRYYAAIARALVAADVRCP
jgi:hypothetical protein